MFEIKIDYFPSDISSSGHSSYYSEDDNCSLSSSGPDFRPIYPEIIKRNLKTDFLEATSLPVNVPLHRSLEALRYKHF